MGISKIELRQVYKDKLYNYRPSWILRWGVTFFFILLLLIIVVSGFIKYPDVVPATVEITTINPPVNLVARVNGKIKEILIREGDQVFANSVLAVLESPSKWTDMLTVENYIQQLDSMTKGADNPALPPPSQFRNNLELGELQVQYAGVKQNYIELYNYLFSGLMDEEQRALSKKITSQEELLLQFSEKRKLLNEQYQLAIRDYQRDSVIYNKKVISISDYEQKYQSLLQVRSSLVDMEISIQNITSSMEQLIIDLKKIRLKYEVDKQQLLNKLFHGIYLLKAQMEMWKQNYLIITPITGNVSYSTYWSQNQNVKSGEVVLFVVPQDSMKIKVRLQFSIQNSGKVKENQRVNIKLHSYPYQEFGMLVGQLSKISEVPNEMMYNADVELEKGLETSYGKTLPKFQQLQGNAEILTDDLSLLMRFFNPLRAIFDNRIIQPNH